MGGAGLPRSGTVPMTVRRRRAFGLDVPRTVDPRRIERAVFAWLRGAFPDIVPLRITCPEAPGPDDTTRRQNEGLAMALLLPHGQVAVLQIGGRGEALGAEASALMRNCQAQRVPIAVIRSLEDARAALRRLGFEPRGNSGARPNNSAAVAQARAPREG